MKGGTSSVRPLLNRTVLSDVKRRRRRNDKKGVIVDPLMVVFFVFFRDLVIRSSLLICEPMVLTYNRS